MIRPLVAPIMFLVLAGCQGMVGEAGSDEDPGTPGPGTPRMPGEITPAVYASAAASRIPLTRITNTQYENAVQFLVGSVDVGHPSENLGAESALGGFRSNATLSVSELEFRRYSDEATRISELVEDPFALAGCSVEDNGCVDDFIATMTRRTFRRPPTDPELNRLRALYDLVEEDVGAADAGQIIIETLLQSPHFLYRMELFPDAAPGDTVQLDGFQIATRLAGFLWESVPDDELLAAAEAGELDTSEGIAVWAAQMIEDPRGRRGVESFHLQWLDVDEIASAAKDELVFADFDSELGIQMREETANFVDHVVREGDGRLATLFLGNYTFLSGDLYEHYGLPGGGDEWARVELDGVQRTGLLTHASFLAMHAHEDQTSPVHRGKVVRENLLCEVMPAPPPEVDDTPPDLDPNLTTRERFSEHSTSPVCRGCHQRMDPLGLGFEAYDGIGRYRAMEAGAPTDQSGEIVGTDVEGDFNGVIELSERLVASEQMRRCLVRNWYQFALGKESGEADIPILDALYEGFSANDDNVRELMVAIAQTEEFRSLRLQEAE